MDKQQWEAIVIARLGKFRDWPYAQLADHLNRNDDCLERFEATAPDGTTYQLEVEVLWDDKTRGDIRVLAHLWADPQKQLLGFLPIYVPHASDSFIMRRDGTFVGEDNE